MTTEFKRCTKCGTKYPYTLEYFQSDKSVKSGLRSQCRECRRQFKRDWYKDTNEIRREVNRAAYARNPETKLKNNKAWFNANKERKKEGDRRYYRQNSERIRAKVKQYRIDHAEIVKERRKREKRNPVVVRLYVVRRRAQLKMLPSDLKPEQWLFALEYFGGCCAVCGKKPDSTTVLAADHWIPLKLGGGTTATNIVPLCHSKKGGSGSCNHHKSHKQPLDWLIERFGEQAAKEIKTRILEYFRHVSI